MAESVTAGLGVKAAGRKNVQECDARMFNWNTFACYKKPLPKFNDNHLSLIKSHYKFYCRASCCVITIQHSDAAFFRDHYAFRVYDDSRYIILMVQFSIPPARVATA